MKRRILIFILLMTILILTAMVVFFNQRQAPDWQAKLNDYLAYLKETGKNSYQVISVDCATPPANFTPGMSVETYNKSLVFQTTHTSNTGYLVSLQPVTYPPKQLVCVLLSVGTQQKLVYIALDHSLHDSDWIVHISSESWGSPVLQTQLYSVGCSL
jgi:hypothetical protein